MEWLLWAGLLFLVIGWPLLFGVASVVRRRILGAPTTEYALAEHAELMAVDDARDARPGRRGW